MSGAPESSSPDVARICCPACGERDRIEPALQLERSFSNGAFLAGGLLGDLLCSAGKARRWRCAQCGELFTAATPETRGARIVALIFFGFVAAAALMAAFGRE